MPKPVLWICVLYEEKTKKHVADDPMIKEDTRTSKEEALDSFSWGSCFGRGCGPVVRHYRVMRTMQIYID
jgi:hypothetical protein